MSAPQDIRLREIEHVILGQPVLISDVHSDRSVLVDIEKGEEIPEDMLDMWVLLITPVSNHLGKEVHWLAIAISD